MKIPGPFGNKTPSTTTHSTRAPHPDGQCGTHVHTGRDILEMEMCLYTSFNAAFGWVGGWTVGPAGRREEGIEARKVGKNRAKRHRNVQSMDVLYSNLPFTRRLALYLPGLLYFLHPSPSIIICTLFQRS